MLIYDSCTLNALPICPGTANYTDIRGHLAVRWDHLEYVPGDLLRTAVGHGCLLFSDANRQNGKWKGPFSLRAVRGLLAI